MLLAQDLTDRKAVVTGGGRGLGLAIAERLAQSGADVTILDLPEVLGEAPSGFKREPVDLAAGSAEERLKAISGHIGPANILVANAGLVPPWRGVDNLDRSEWDRVMTVNVWGVAAALGAFAANLERAPNASAIVMASINGFRAHPKQVLYTASKHAVIGVMRAAALDLGGRGIRVNALAPGPIATEALLSRVQMRHEAGGPAPDQALSALADETALGRIATAEQVADAAHFLASDASAGITGCVIPVEAGLS